MVAPEPVQEVPVYGIYRFNELAEIRLPPFIDDRLEQLILALKIPVDRSLRKIDRIGNIFDRGALIAFMEEEANALLQYPLLRRLSAVFQI
jgi:hypothetical protein